MLMSINISLSDTAGLTLSLFSLIMQKMKRIASLFQNLETNIWKHLEIQSSILARYNRENYIQIAITNADVGIPKV